MEPILKTIGSGSSPTRLHWRHDCPPAIASIYGTLRAGGNRECEVLHIRMRTETESKKKDAAMSPAPAPNRSGKYGRAAADALSDARCGMRCADEPQLKQDEGDEQDGDTGDIAPALYQ